MQVTTKLLQFFAMVDLYSGYKAVDKEITTKYVNKILEYSKDVGYDYLKYDDFDPWCDHVANVVFIIIKDGLMATLTNDQLKKYHNWAIENVMCDEDNVDFVLNKLDTLTTDIFEGI